MYFNIIHIIFEYAIDVYASKLKQGSAGYKYLSSRGLSKQSIDRAKIGFVPYNNIIFSTLCCEHKFNIYDVLRASLLKINLHTAQIEDYFKGPRIIMPIFYNDQVVTLQTRTINNVEPKYLNLPKPYSLFPFYNLDVLKAGHDTIFLAEGIIDAILLEQIGLPSVGILGANRINRRTVNYLAQYKGNYVFLFDTDNNKAGYTAAVKACNLMHQAGIDNIFTFLVTSS